MRCSIDGTPTALTAQDLRRSELLASVAEAAEPFPLSVPLPDFGMWRNYDPLEDEADAMDSEDLIRVWQVIFPTCCSATRRAGVGCAAAFPAA